MGNKIGRFFLAAILFVATSGVFLPSLGNAAGGKCRKICVTEYIDPNGCQVIRTEYYSCDGEYLGAVTVWYC